MNEVTPSSSTNTAKPDAVNNFLTLFKCCSPVFPNDFGSVVRISDNASIQEAFEKMTDNHILSLPVVNYDTGRPLYVLTLMDIMAYMIKHFKESDFKHDFYHKLINWFNDKANTIAHQKVSVIEEKAEYDIDPVFSVSKEATLEEAVNIMLEKKCHRVLVVGPNGELENLITQSRVAQFLSAATDTIPKCSKTLKQLGLGFKEVVTVSENDTAYQAFKLMTEKHISAVAVVDQHGHLSGNISVSDLKLVGFDTSYWNLLGFPVKDYLLKLAENPDLTKARPHIFAWLQEKNQPPVVVKCKPTDTLGFAVQLINFYRVHRIYIVDGDLHPVGILSLHDILEALCTKD